MFQWIVEHSSFLNALSGIGMLCVWIVYLNVFLSGVHRDLRSNILISRGSGEDLEARCLVSNMSARSIYIASVLVTIEADGHSFRGAVTEHTNVEGELPRKLLDRTRQGPLQAAEMRDIGSFRELVDHVWCSNPAHLRESLSGLDFVVVELVCIYTSEDIPVGARRRFRFSDGEHPVLRGVSPHTEQIRSKSSRKRLAASRRNDP